MPQLDFLVMAKLSMICASIVVFVAFVLLFTTALSAWLESQVRIMAKVQLIQETKSIAILAGSKTNVVANGFVAFFNYDLLEQFVFAPELLAFIFFILALLNCFIIINIFSRLMSNAFSFVSTLNKDINQENAASAGRNSINLTTIFVCVLIFNMAGIAPLSYTFTSSVTAPFFFSTIIFFVCVYQLVTKNRISLMAGFLPTGTSLAIVPLIVSIEFISNIAKFISLGIRLFANMFAGHLLLKVFYSISFQIVSTLVAFTAFAQAVAFIFIVFITLLELMIAFLQAFVMLLLSVLYIKEAEGFIQGH